MICMLNEVLSVRPTLATQERGKTSTALSMRQSVMEVSTNQKFQLKRHKDKAQTTFDATLESTERLYTL